MCSDLFLSVFIHANSEYFNSFWTRIFIFPSLRSRRLKVVGARNNERARGRHALARPFFLGPATQAKFLDNGVMMSPKAGRNIISLVFMFLFLYYYFSKPTQTLKSVQVIYLFHGQILHSITYLPCELQELLRSEAGDRFDWRVTVVVITHAPAFPQVTKQVTKLCILDHSQGTFFQINDMRFTSIFFI